MLGIGLGLLIGFFICASTIPNYVRMDDNNWNIRQMTSIIYGAGVLFFGGIGLLAAFLIENQICKRSKG